MTEKKRGRWKPGESGNPDGKPHGSGALQKLRAAIGDHIPEILDRLVTSAKEGDIQAARLLLERVLPPVKAIDQPQAFNLPDGSLSDQGRAVIAAIASGELPTSHGAQLLTALGTLGKVVEIDELDARIRKLEERHAR